MKEYGVAILGYGFIGKVHAYAYRNMGFFYEPPPLKTRLVAVCTSRPETAQAAKEHGGFETCGTDAIETVRRDDVDIVNVCTPNHLHKDALLAAMEAGKHIYCDKPLVGTIADAEALAPAMGTWRGIGQMTFNNRFSLPALRAKQMIDEGFVGRVTQFRAAYLHSGSVPADKVMGWKQRADAGGGVLNDLGSHVVDLAEWLAGPIAEVMAETRILHPERPAPGGGRETVDAEDAAILTVRLADGAVGSIEASKIATGTEDELRVEIHGQRGALRFDTMQPAYLEAYDLSDPEAPQGGVRGWKRIATVHRFDPPGGWPGPKFAPGWLRSHVHCLWNFLNAVAQGQPTEPSLPRGLEVQRILEAARKSAAERKWVAAG